MRIMIYTLALSALLLAPWPSQAKAPASGSVRIEEQTTHLKREDGQEAVIHAPVVKGVPDEDLRSRIQDSAGLKAGTDKTLEEWKKDFEESWWLNEIEYKVGYNRNFILNLIYTVSGAGAYPDSTTTSLVVDLRTGKRLAARDLFKSSSLGALAARLNRELKADVEATRRKWGADWDGEEDVKNARFDVDHLNDFTIGARGITFHYEFGFAHVMKAEEPRGTYFLSWKQLAPYIDRRGPLGMFFKN